MFSKFLRAFFPKLLSFRVLVFLIAFPSLFDVGSNIPPLIFWRSLFLDLGDIPSSFSIFLILYNNFDFADFKFTFLILFKSGSVCLDDTFMLESCLEFLLFIIFGGFPFAPPWILLLLALGILDKFELLSPLLLLFDIRETLLFSLLTPFRVIFTLRPLGALFTTESVNFICFGYLLDLVVSMEGIWTSS